MSGSLLGFKVTGKPPTPSRQFAAGRVCEQEGCSTSLSVYNSSRYCWTHSPLRYPTYRGRPKVIQGKALPDA